MLGVSSTITQPGRDQDGLGDVARGSDHLRHGMSVSGERRHMRGAINRDGRRQPVIAGPRPAVNTRPTAARARTQQAGCRRPLLSERTRERDSSGRSLLALRTWGRCVTYWEDVVSSSRTTESVARVRLARRISTSLGRKSLVPRTYGALLIITLKWALLGAAAGACAYLRSGSGVRVSADRAADLRLAHPYVLRRRSR